MALMTNAVLSARQALIKLSPLFSPVPPLTEKRAQHLVCIIQLSHSSLLSHQRIITTSIPDKAHHTVYATTNLHGPGNLISDHHVNSQHLASQAGHQRPHRPRRTHSVSPESETLTNLRISKTPYFTSSMHACGKHITGPQHRKRQRKKDEKEKDNTDENKSSKHPQTNHTDILPPSWWPP